MAPQVPNNTGRIFVDYAGLMGSRTMQFRFSNGTDVATAFTAVEAFVEAVAENVWFTTTQVTGYRAQAAGGLITFPIGGSAFNGQQPGVPAVSNYPYFIAFQGRGSVSGRRVRLSIYGTNVTVTPDYRIDTENVPAVAALIAALRVVAQAGAFVTIDGEIPTIPEYANTGFNSYYQRKARRA